MKAKAVRMHGTKDLRLDEFELPPIGTDEILAKVITDSLCVSSYKEVIQGEAHKRVTPNITERPVVIGHEFCGELLEVGEKWKDRFKPGQRFAVQPALNYHGSMDAPGYSYPYIGGDATYVVIPNEVMEMDCLLPYDGDTFYGASLAEPLACVCHAVRSMYHVPAPDSYVHEMGIRTDGNMAVLAGSGPMGLAMVDYTIHSERRPSRIVVTDIDETRLARARKVLPPEEAAKFGVELMYVNTSGPDPVGALRKLTGGKGFDDAFIIAQVPALVEQADAILGVDGCLNFFSGPTNPEFFAKLNFYNIHYNGTHAMGSTGSSTNDMRECLAMVSSGELNPSLLITHIGGLNAVPEATLHLPEIPGGKKLIYTHADLPLTAIKDFPELGKTDPFFARLAEITDRAGGLWCKEAEVFLLKEKTTVLD